MRESLNRNKLASLLTVELIVLLAAYLGYLFSLAFGFYEMAILGTLVVTVPAFNYLYAPSARLKKFFWIVTLFMVIASVAIYIDLGITRRAVEVSCREAYSHSTLISDDGLLLCRGGHESEGFSVNTQTITWILFAPVLVLTLYSLLSAPYVLIRNLLRRQKS